MEGKCNFDQFKDSLDIILKGLEKISIDKEISSDMFKILSAKIISLISRIETIFSIQKLNMILLGILGALLIGAIITFSGANKSLKEYSDRQDYLNTVQILINKDMIERNAHYIDSIMNANRQND